MIVTATGRMAANPSAILSIAAAAARHVMAAVNRDNAAPVDAVAARPRATRALQRFASIWRQPTCSRVHRVNPAMQIVTAICPMAVKPIHRLRLRIAAAAVRPVKPPAFVRAACA